MKIQYTKLHAVPMCNSSKRGAQAKGIHTTISSLM